MQCNGINPSCLILRAHRTPFFFLIYRYFCPPSFKHECKNVASKDVNTLYTRVVMECWPVAIGTTVIPLFQLLLFACSLSLGLSWCKKCVPYPLPNTSLLKCGAKVQYCSSVYELPHVGNLDSGGNTQRSEEIYGQQGMSFKLILMLLLWHLCILCWPCPHLPQPLTLQ